MIEEISNPFADGVDVKFKCSECGLIIEERLDGIPLPNFEGDSHYDSFNEDDHYLECPQCHKNYIFTISSALDGCTISCDDLDECSIDEIYNFDDDSWYKEQIQSYFINNFNDHISKIQELMTDNDNSLLLELLYANVITTLEAYLSEVLTYYVLNHDNYKRKFVKSFVDYKNINVNLTNLYDIYDDIDKRISNTLKDLIYHHLPKIRGIYKDTLDVDMGSIKDIMLAVEKRHHIIHRNGKDKDGNAIVISKVDVEKLISIVIDFVENIEKQLDEKQI